MFHDAEQLKKIALPEQLQKFSFANLSWLLRHREYWPEDFVWCYSWSWRCAMALANKVYNVNVFDSRFDEIDDREKTHIFYQAWFGKIGNFVVPIPILLPSMVTPNRIANMIDRAILGEK